MRTLLKKGKVKDVYDIGQNQLLFVFTNRISSFDLILPSEIPRKGEILCKFAEFWFTTLNARNHMIRIKDKNKMIVRKLEIVPIECVVRGYLYGSLFKRVLNGSVSLPIEPILASHLPEPIFDPTTKFEKKDRPVTQEEILSKGWVTKKELFWIQEKSIALYNQMAEICSKAGFIMADVKFEFGRDGDEIILADSLGPDEFRLWPIDKYKPGEIQISYDKQLVRDWLIKVGFKEKLDQHEKKENTFPQPPELPFKLITKVSKRYAESFERISNWKLG